MNQFSICRGDTKVLLAKGPPGENMLQLRPTLVGCNYSLEIEGQDLCSIGESSQIPEIL